jgi:hypothetical protein
MSEGRFVPTGSVEVGMTDADELVGWLRAQLADDERVAREAPGPDWVIAVERNGEAGRWLGAKAHSVALPARDSWDSVGVGDVVLQAEHVNDGKHAARWAVEHAARWDPARVLAEIDAKRARINWLASLEHDMGDEDFPTYNSCRMLNEPGTLGDIEVGYCSCGLDDRRVHLLKFDALPFADRRGYRAEWAPGV